jgi:pyruvate,water dikinase
MFGVHRDLYLAIGTRLHERRWLDTPRDVFYLTVDEIDAFAAGTSATTDLMSLVRARRAELARFEHEELPNRFETVGPVGDGVAFANLGVQPANDGTRTLLGTGCSSGSATGAVRIVRGPDDDFPARGAVLVARRTDPGWAPLFPSATAIVVERGSTLSHSAVLARELGIPAVVGIPHLLATLHDGEQVRVDGGAGSVERLELAP